MLSQLKSNRLNRFSCYLQTFNLKPTWEFKYIRFDSIHKHEKTMLDQYIHNLLILKVFYYSNSIRKNWTFENIILLFFNKQKLKKYIF